MTSLKETTHKITFYTQAVTFLFPPYHISLFVWTTYVYIKMWPLVHEFSATKAISPGYTFPELLRRSRFASFDPTIRQSYGTPPSHLHRGNWGLKRPIAQRKRNAFISLKNFEEHEHYIEWSNAETQVRLINKIEEINVAPKLVSHVPWFVGLGPAASSDWSKMDSEFAPGQSGMPHIPEDSIPSFTPALEGLGLRGKGKYGMASVSSDDGYLHPNLRAMSPRVFNRYLKKLRSLRPQFQKFLKENGNTASVRESGIPPGNLHIRFLGQHFDKQFRDPTKELDPNQTEPIPQQPARGVHPNQPRAIRQQPHRLAGLMYSSPTFLESFFTSRTQPGIVLESNDNSRNNSPEYLVSTAGIVGRLEEKRAGPNVKPAFNDKSIAYPPAALLAGRTGVNTFINVRVVDIHLERPPVAVTAFPSANSSKEVRIRLDLASHSSQIEHSRSNTHPPGSMLYNAPEDSPQQKHSPYGNVFAGYKIYTRNPADKLDGTGIGNPVDILKKISRGTPQPDVGLKWDNRPGKVNWRDEQWEEGPNPDKDDGNSG